MKYTDLSIQDRQDILRRVQSETGKDPQIVEKDWWVVAVLRALFELPYAQHISFKGGTSLSKCWNLIQRMSEDVDIAIDREYLGFGGPLSRTQISDRLRRAACSFVREKLQFDLAAQLEKDGISPDSFKVTVDITPVSTTDPETIKVEYTPVFDATPYIRSKVLIEVSGRSMGEPVENVPIRSYIDEVYTDASFAESAFEVRAVVPQRTFLEKLFLLHEEFAKRQADIRVDRMSRHIYDICKIASTPIADQALADNGGIFLVIEATEGQSNGVSRAHSKASAIKMVEEPTAAAIDIRADYVAKNGAPSAAAPKIFFRYYYVNSSTGEKSGTMLAETSWTAAAAGGEP